MRRGALIVTGIFTRTAKPALIPVKFVAARALAIAAIAGCSLVALSAPGMAQSAGAVIIRVADPGLALPELPDTAEATTRDLAGAAREADSGTSESEPSRTASPNALVLPALPEVVASFDPPAAEKAEKPVELALPDLPQPGLSSDLAAGTPTGDIVTGSVASEAQKAEALRLDIPAVPEVKLAVAPLDLDLTEDKLKALLQPARQKYRLGVGEVESFVAAYAARGFRAIWLDGEGHDLLVSPRAIALRENLANAATSGLDANRLIAVLPATRSGKVPADKRSETDIGFSLAAFIHARDLRGGRLEPSRVSALMTPKLELPVAADLLAKLASADAKGIGAAILAYEPQHAGYQTLKTALAKAREDAAKPVLTGAVAGMANAPHPASTLPPNWLDGPVLAFNKPDPRVPLLRTRLGLPAGGDVYDQETRAAVINFQRANRLAPNARLTPKTRAALENPEAPLKPEEVKDEPGAPIERILANMERWRWLPADLGSRHILVNIADYDLKMFDEGRMIHNTRVIVGKAITQTPIFSDVMEHVIVNPSWGVPQSIIRKEFLPKMASDPDYAKRRGYEVVRRGNQVFLRQPPGAGNALGYVKMIFPNDHAVYLHDTPSRGLFANEARAFSHGCVRVQNPFALAEKVLESTGYTEAQLKGMIGRGERMIRLKEHLPVHLAYFTSFVDDKGELQHRRDIYGHDIRIRNALRS
jgi:murein L,D-transpeptidase YcbB/YkuD